MPKSKTRKKSVYTPPPKTQQIKVSPRWLVPAMLAFLVLGLLWIATFYMTSAAGIEVPFMTELSNWNLAIGFGAIIIGVILSTKWR